MSEKFIIVDCNYLCHRAYYRLHDFDWNELKTGVIFGFFNTILTLTTKLKSNKFIFCWDSKDSFRKQDSPIYKANRSQLVLSPSEKEVMNQAYAQFDAIRKEILPALGFNNVFMQDGIEGDDLMAWLVMNQDFKESIIVSSDKDLYQLLHHVKGIYHPDKKQLYTELDFVNEHGIFPEDWPTVKAIVGDKSDNIPGIPGIGEVTAIKFLTNKKLSQRQLSAIWNNENLRTENLKLVKLPHPKTQPISMNGGDDFNWQEFTLMCNKYGFGSYLQTDNYLKWRKAFGK